MASSVADFSKDPNFVLFLALRLLNLSLLVCLLTVHIRSVRVFRWEQSVSGGIIVTYFLVVIGLSLCTGVHDASIAFQVYLCGLGAVLFGLNGVAIYRRWKNANELTRVVSELLEAMGVPLRRQVYIKSFLSTSISILLLIDFAWNLVIYTQPPK